MGKLLSTAKKNTNGFVLIGYNWDKETLVYYDVPQEVIRKIVRDGGSIRKPLKPLRKQMSNLLNNYEVTKEDLYERYN